MTSIERTKKFDSPKMAPTLRSMPPEMTVSPIPRTMKTNSGSSRSHPQKT